MLTGDALYFSGLKYHYREEIFTTALTQVANGKSIALKAYGKSPKRKVFRHRNIGKHYVRSLLSSGRHYHQPMKMSSVANDSSILLRRFIV
jgi:hypothetical protein